PQRKKLSYLESREYESIERTLLAMEEAIHEKRASLQEAALKDGRALEQMYREIEASQQAIDQLYARWAELEEKIRYSVHTSRMLKKILREGTSPSATSFLRALSLSLYA